ncbi:MAG: SBBP repeat-containing protein [Bryobacteraceae bacterium]
MLSRLALISVFAIGPLAAQVQLQFPFGVVQPGATYSAVLPIASGDRLLVGTQPASSVFGTPRQAIALAATGSAPFQDQFPLSVLGGNGNDQPAAAAIDPQGNIWIVGSTNSDDFKLVNPIVSQKVPYRTAGFVIELDPTGYQILFATYLCGDTPGNSYTAGRLSSYANQIVFDGGGNAYVAGATDEVDFPVTAAAFQAKGGGGDAFGDTFFSAFLVKISPAGKLIYSTLLGGSSGDCSGGSSCIGKESTYTSVNGMAVDTNGSVTLSGVTDTTNFPVTAGALQQSCGGVYPYGSGFVTRLMPDASKLAWSTCFSGDPSLGAILYLGMAQDSQENVDLFGEYAPYSGSLMSITSIATPGLFAAQLSSDGSKLLYSTNLGQSPDASAHDIALDSTGNEYLSGTSSSAQFPSLPDVPNLGADFVLRLDASGSPRALVRLPGGTLGGPPAFDASGNLLLVSGQVAVLQLPAESAAGAPAVVGFGNSASFAVNRGLYPGALVSLFGFSLAGEAQVAVPDASGKFPTALGGVQVLVNDIPAPLLYVGPNQINLQVPFEIGQSDPYSQLQVQLTLPSGALTMQFAESAALGLFMSGGGPAAAALNQDGTVNSATNPAAPGSIVSLFATGAAWPSGLVDGALASGASVLSQELNEFQVVDAGGVEASILYAGAAPGLIDGVFQLNVQLPVGETNPVFLTLSSSATTPLGSNLQSNRVQIYSQ